MLKIIKNYLILFILLISFTSYGMMREREYPVLYSNAPEQQYNANVQVLFAPDDRKAMKDSLFLLLDNAKKSIYVVMYWITDDSLIDKLIAAKNRGLDVQIYIDESSPNLNTYITTLMNNHLRYFVFPSQSQPQNGILHNKYFIIDDEIVFTGSANFTRAAFDENSTNFNRENSIMIHSEDVTFVFLKDFVNIQAIIFNHYIDMISNLESSQLPQWFSQLAPYIFHLRKEIILTRELHRRMDEYGSDDPRWKRAHDFIMQCKPNK